MGFSVTVSESTLGLSSVCARLLARFTSSVYIPAFDGAVVVVVYFQGCVSVSERVTVSSVTFTEASPPSASTNI